MPATIRLCPTPGTELRRSGGGWRALRGRIEVRLEGVGAGVDEALALLAAGGAAEESLRAVVVAAEGYAALAELYEQLSRLAERFLLAHQLVDAAARPLVTSEPLAPEHDFAIRPLGPEQRFVLSRFVYLRRDGDTATLESPRAKSRVLLHRPGVRALVAELFEPRRLTDLRGAGTSLDAETVAAVIGMLAASDFLIDAEPPDEEHLAPLLGWEFHDLLFHSRSRLGRHRNPYGRTYRLSERMEPLAAFKPPEAGRSVALERPDIDAPGGAEPRFTEVLEGRRSRRAHGEPPISRRELGEFLFRAAGARGEPGLGGSGSDTYEICRRPFPGGGSAYELEIYPLVARCGDLEPGLYHYRPREHQLVSVSDPSPLTEALLATAAAAAEAAVPQVLVVLSARFLRLSWKYSSIGYATVLKDVGVLLQTMYLVAEAMGLAACALGGGNSDVFAEAAGTDYYAETSVGELMLGSRRDDEPRS